MTEPRNDSKATWVDWLKLPFWLAWFLAPFIAAIVLIAVSA